MCITGSIVIHIVVTSRHRVLARMHHFLLSLEQKYRRLRGRELATNERKIPKTKSIWRSFRFLVTARINRKQQQQQ